MSETIWSFSRLNAFHICPLMWKKNYIDEECGEGNAFADYGTMVHNIIEEWINGKLLTWELADEYKKRFMEIEHPFPFNPYTDLRENYYKNGYEYFKNFDEFDGYTPLITEKEVIFEIEKYKFKGFPDLVAEDNFGNLVIFDHKSSNIYKGKKLEDRIRQLYFYSIPVQIELGKYPDYLIFNHFRKNIHDIHQFNFEQLEKTKKWAIKTIKQIKNCKEFKPNINEFFCTQLCAYRNSCEYAKF